VPVLPPRDLLPARAEGRHPRDDASVSRRTVSTLRIADGLKLPIEAATQTFAFIARKGAGKTYTAGKLVELLLEADVQVTVLDTVGNWYGLRLSADGKESGFDVPVIGGLRGDIPLEATGGQLIADVVVDSGRSMVLDLSQFSLADRKRFATAFGQRLWIRKKGEAHPAPLHMVIEESQLIVPQKVDGNTAPMVGIYEEIIRLGRNYGIGVSMISQRPQSVNKDVLNQTECLFVGQVNGAQERKALKEWITHQGMDVHLVDELPSLPIGTFYVWSPQWLQILKKVEILPKKTADTSATPKVGGKQVRRELKPLDLKELQQQLAATIERATQEDPRALRAKVAELQRLLQHAHGKETRVEVPVIKDAQITRLEKVAARFETLATTLADARTEVVNALKAATVQPSGLHGRSANPRSGGGAPGRPVVSRPVVPQARRDAGVRRREPAEGLTAPEQRILDSIAWWKAAGIEQPSREQVAFGARYSVNGHFNNVLGTLRIKGFLDYPKGNHVALTAAGEAAANRPDTVATYQELVERAMSVLRDEPSRRIFDRVVKSGQVLTREELAEAAGYTVNGHFNNVLGRLRTLGLITYPAGNHVALGEMFEGLPA